MSNLLNKFQVKNVLMILDQKSKDNIYKAGRNIPDVKIVDVNHFSIYDLAKHKKVMLTATSIKEIEKRYS